MLEIIGEHGRIEIEVLGVQLEPRADYGVMSWKVSIRSYDLSGQYDRIWILPSVYESFLQQLDRLEQSRQGAASLTGTSPEEFRLNIRSYDRLGHMLVEGQLGRYTYIGWGSPLHLQKLEIAFAIDPSILPEITRGFSAFKTWA